jgi:hypothetical protein
MQNGVACNIQRGDSPRFEPPPQCAQFATELADARGIPLIARCPWRRGQSNLGSSRGRHFEDGLLSAKLRQKRVSADPELIGVVPMKSEQQTEMATGVVIGEVPAES